MLVKHWGMGWKDVEGMGYWGAQVEDYGILRNVGEVEAVHCRIVCKEGLYRSCSVDLVSSIIIGFNYLLVSLDNSS